MIGAACVFVGAGLGAVLRWRLGVWLAAVWPAFPLGTTAANLIGSFLIGVVAGYFEARPELPQEYRLLATTGFLGGFTTFSAFSLEALDLVSTRTVFATFFIVGKVALCIMATFAGFALARR